MVGLKEYTERRPWGERKECVALGWGGREGVRRLILFLGGKERMLGGGKGSSRTWGSK